ncbi:hypothetical protein BKA82DRAFT_871000 [Pisolithus tinctorius]|nr:hypothetical protein BKA82DRAFT_871000 [Pisolithus tinctorius]
MSSHCNSPQLSTQNEDRWFVPPRLLLQRSAEGMPAPVYASSPFNHSKADVILRSSDNVDFRVFKLFLSLSSPFFETLFDLPQPSEAEHPADTEMKDGLPVLPVSEDSRTLDGLLRFCYPCTLSENPPLNHFRDVIKVLEAAQKYALDEVENTIRKALFNPTILELNSLRCFAIARKARLREETTLAARYSLRISLVPNWFEEIEMITATDLLALLAYHQKCGWAVQKLQLGFSWIEEHYQSRAAVPWIFGETPGRSCGCPRADTIKLFGQRHLVWWEEFMEATFRTLKEKPCARTVHKSVEKTIGEVRRRNCQSCTPDIATVMNQFADLFARKVEELVSEVELHLTY